LDSQIKEGKVREKNNSGNNSKTFTDLGEYKLKDIRTSMNQVNTQTSTLAKLQLLNSHFTLLVHLAGLFKIVLCQGMLCSFFWDFLKRTFKIKELF